MSSTSGRRLVLQAAQRNAFDRAGVWGLASYRPGGASALMLDGAARFLKDRMNINAPWSLGSIA